MKRMSLVVTVLLILLASLNAPCASAAKELYIIRSKGAISPGVAQFLKSGLQKAEAQGAVAVIIELDTPGGLAESMREIDMAILASKVPVVVYVAPSGARAASAGVMITIAADVAAMAPSTNIGAAHPVGIGGKEIDKTMADKVTNDMVAHARSVAEQRGRNADWVERAVRESVSITETEALELRVIDLVAADMDDLIRQLDGRQIKGKGTLDLTGAVKVVLKEDLRTKVLKAISDPNIAYILLMIGLAGLYFEFSHPGTIFPGVIGAIAIVLAFFAFQTLPVNYAGVLLILLGLVFFIMEMKIVSFGLLSVAGVTALLLGSLMLFGETGTDFGLSWRVLLPTLALIAGFFVVVAGIVFRAQVSTPRTGSVGMVGEIGVVKAPLQPAGKVLVHGEIWQAVARQSIAVNNRVRVTGIDGLVLEVEELAAPSADIATGKRNARG